LGECQACHEAGVRWYCDNHDPARWLDTPACASCGATRHRGPIVHDPPPKRTPGGSYVVEPPLIDVPSRTPRTPPSTRKVTPPEAPARVDANDSLELFHRTSATAGREHTTPESGGEPSRLPRVAAGRSPIASFALRVAIVLMTLVLLSVGTVHFFGGSAASNVVVDVAQSIGVLSDVPGQTTRGIRAYQAGDLETAERELGEAAHTYQHSGLALLYLARIRLESGDSSGTGSLLEEAIAREPNSALANRMLGEYHLMRARRGIVDASSRVFSATEYAAAEERLSRAMALDPGDMRAEGYHACALAAVGRNVESKIELASAGPGPWEQCMPDESPP
jgi:hypothetical protein